MADEPDLILVSPTTVSGAPGRILTYPDGKIVVQRWDGSKWVTDKSRVVPGAKPTPKQISDD